jgi:predicted ATP-binding protein involved in virulence
MDEISNSNVNTSQITLPDFRVDSLPSTKILKLRIKNFKAFEDSVLDFSDGNSYRGFSCFIGPNGCGKSTVLNVVQLIFSNFHGYTEERLVNNLGRAVRHVNLNSLPDDDFLIEANMTTSLGNYVVRINKHGFVDPHPEEIAQYAYRLCYAARFDQELHNFQLRRDQWDKFKSLFESVTDFTIKEHIDLFSSNSDRRQRSVMDEYVLGFTVNKPYESISHKECSAGERKLIKTFSTLLNLEFMPEVILIDNIEMHVDISRHLPFVNALRHNFPNSQIITTTHSYHISRNFSERSQIYDLRMIRGEQLLREQPWRLYMIDEIEDSIVRLNSLSCHQQKTDLITEGHTLQNLCRYQIESIEDLQKKLKKFMTKASDAFVSELMT